MTAMRGPSSFFLDFVPMNADMRMLNAAIGLLGSIFIRLPGPYFFDFRTFLPGKVAFMPSTNWSRYSMRSTRPASLAALP